MSTQTVVIKYGGHAMDKDELNAAFADDMAFCSRACAWWWCMAAGPRSTPC